MLKIRRPLGRLIFNMGIAIPGKTVFLIETAPCFWYTRPKSMAHIVFTPAVWVILVSLESCGKSVRHVLGATRVATSGLTHPHRKVRVNAVSNWCHGTFDFSTKLFKFIRVEMVCKGCCPTVIVIPKDYQDSIINCLYMYYCLFVGGSRWRQMLYLRKVFTFNSDVTPLNSRLNIVVMKYIMNRVAV